MKRAALSASRVKDFLQCPLMFRFRVVDKIPEAPSLAATKGTLVHAVLERLFDLPAGQRTPSAAAELLEPQWTALLAKNPELLGLFAAAGELDVFLAQARALVANYFQIENPRRLEPDSRERFVEVELADGVLLRGFIDRVDRAASGAIRLVDYKSGKSPAARFADSALFQMRFYALLIWRLEGVVPARLQLLYLADGRTLTLDPHEAELADFEREVSALWSRIERAARQGEFPARKGPLCPWCSFQALCPAFGGEAPPLNHEGVARLLGVRRRPSGTASPGASPEGLRA